MSYFGIYGLYCGRCDIYLHAGMPMFQTPCPIHGRGGYDFRTEEQKIQDNKDGTMKKIAVQDAQWIRDIAQK